MYLHFQDFKMDLGRKTKKVSDVFEKWKMEKGNPIQRVVLLPSKKG